LISTDTMKTTVFLQEENSGKTHQVDLPCVLGRMKEVDLSIPDPTVSQRHALMSFSEGRVWIEDLHSTNGVFLNGIRILDRTPVKAGDKIVLGHTAFSYVQEEAEPFEKTVVIHSLDHHRESRLDYDRFKLIHEITTQLSENHDIKSLQKNLAARLKEIFHHDRGCLALFQEDGSLKSILSESAMDALPVSSSIVERVFRCKESLVLSDAMEDASLKEQESIISHNIRSALCAPLLYHGRIYGLVYLDRNVPGAYNEQDLEVLRTIALIVAPLVENARLWSELKEHYDQAVSSLRETEAKLIEREREAAYVRLAQAMAHEIRNPLMGIGGLARRMLQSETPCPEQDRLHSILGLAERVEDVLKEVDEFVKLPEPELRMERIDQSIQKCIGEHSQEWNRTRIRPLLEVHTTHLLVPIDSGLFSHAIAMILKEIMPGMPEDSDCRVSIYDRGKEIAIVIGEGGMEKCTGEIYDEEIKRKPWSMGLFLNIAHKIISDHAGRMLFDPHGRSAYPTMITLPRNIRMQSAPDISRRATKASFSE